MEINKTDKKIRIAVLFGGRSGEHEVSLMSARSVLNALDLQKYEVVEVGITHEGRWLVGEGVLTAMQAGKTDALHRAALFGDPTLAGLYKLVGAKDGMRLEFLEQVDVVFPVLHGTYGEDGTIQGLFEMADIAFVGAGVLGSALGMDKAIFKDVMRTHNIPVVESITVNRKEFQSNMDDVLNRAEKMASYPLFVKPVNLGSSVGVSKCNNRSDLLEGLLEAARYDRRVLVERGINGREIEVSVLGNDEPVASIPGEVIPADEFYSYDAKYYNERSQLLIPAPISDEMAQKVQRNAIAAYKAVDCAGMARADFLLDKESDELFLNEINTIPGFTQISMYPKLWNATGIGYPQLVDRLIELALERKVESDATERRYIKS